MTLGTRIAVLKDGRLVQFDTPREIYHRPASRFVAEFIGRPAMNVIDGAIAGGVFRADGLELAVPGHGDGDVGLGIRPEHIVLHVGRREGALAFKLDVKELVEPDVLLFVTRGALSLIVRAKADLAGLDALEPGAEVFLELPGERLHLFDAETGLRQS